VLPATVPCTIQAALAQKVVYPNRSEGNSLRSIPATSYPACDNSSKSLKAEEIQDI
jgi:hypothetical protein